MTSKALTILVVVLGFSVLFSGAFASIAVAQEDPDNTPGEDEETDSEGDSDDSEDEVEETQTRVVDVSSILTVTQLDWREDGSVAVTVQASRSHEVVKVVRKGDRRFTMTSVTVPQGSSVILVENVQNKFALVSNSQGYEFRDPRMSLWDLPPSEWVLSWSMWLGAIIGTVLSTLYCYRRIVYNKLETVRSIFEIQWW